MYEAETYQNAGTMDYSPSAAAVGWRFRVRMQVAGDKINFRVTDRSSSQYVGPWSTTEWAWDKTTFTSGPSSGSNEFSITYKNGQAVSIDVPSSFETHHRNMARAFATSWQISLENKDYFLTQEVINQH